MVQITKNKDGSNHYRNDVPDMATNNLNATINKFKNKKAMKVFVWERVDSCSDSYHREGGVVVFARDEERARAIANAVDGCEIRPDEQPDDIRDTVGEEAVYIMPDAGCCY